MADRPDRGHGRLERGAGVRPWGGRYPRGTGTELVGPSSQETCREQRSTGGRLVGLRDTRWCRNLGRRRRRTLARPVGWSGHLLRQAHVGPRLVGNTHSFGGGPRCVSRFLFLGLARWDGCRPLRGPGLGPSAFPPGEADVETDQEPQEGGSHTESYEFLTGEPRATPSRRSGRSDTDGDLAEGFVRDPAIRYIDHHTDTTRGQARTERDPSPPGRVERSHPCGAEGPREHRRARRERKIRRTFEYSCAAFWLPLTAWSAPAKDVKSCSPSNLRAAFAMRRRLRA